MKNLTFLSKKGFSLIGALVSAVIVVVAILALYISVVFTETRLVQNYHYRRAFLIASGEVNRQYYYLMTGNKRPNFRSRAVTIYDGANGGLGIKGNIEMKHRADLHSSEDPLGIKHDELEITVSWVEYTDVTGFAMSHTRFARISEDVYVDRD